MGPTWRLAELGAWAKERGAAGRKRMVRARRVAETGCSPRPSNLPSEGDPMTTAATTRAPARLLTPSDHALVLIDFQAQMAFAAQSVDGVCLRNNASIAARAGAGFKVPTILTTVAARRFSGPMFEEVTDAFPGQELIDRSTMNCWEDANVVRVINAIGRQRVVLAGLWTSVCIVGPALSALEQGFEVFVLTDACGDVTAEAHERAVTRMVQAGAQPMT